ncbi:RHOMBOID-like protein 12, mitochondrial isoform X2 [Cornus florida]|uniref:RHOMBOID-like protein 12, mitochondrial isoform X2 n=1 Tax=Cornus florida TaxID=4283 RepID=UPI00289E667E|nr:RHOMBOID-like protein 12, mitochondrial isoform X2 [Cornus florida]
MQWLLSFKQISKIPRNLSNGSSSFQTVCSNDLLSLSKTNPNHIHGHTSLNQPHHFFSNSTPSPNKFSQKIYGSLSNPILRKQSLSNIVLKAPSKNLVDGGVGFLRAQFSRQFFNLNSFHGARFPRPSFNFNSSYLRYWHSWRRRLTPNGVVLGLILTNVAVFMLWRIAGREFMMKNFTISVENFKRGRVHTMITSAFSHADAGHLISNMIASAFGPEFLLQLYLSGAVVGSIFYLVHHAFMASSSKSQNMWTMDPSRIPGLGASGAVNAIMLLDIFLFPKSTIYLNFFIPVPAILLGIFLIGKDMLRILEGNSQISGSAHLGGAVVAAISWARIRRGRF